MANIVDYLCDEFDTLAERPLGDVDSLILSLLSYYRLPEEAASARTQEGMPFAELYRAGMIRESACVLDPAETGRYMLAATVASPRFCDMRVCRYVEKFDPATEKQFSAMTLALPENVTYVAFRGTDNSLVGWKEDFNMAFETEIPSQREAVEYLEDIAAHTSGPLYVGGHSKGGNLAVYATVMCSEPVCARIRAAFSHDGPGFTPEMMARSAWAERAHLIHKTIPNQSLVGMIFETSDDYTVVSSTGQGIMQHDGRTWEVEGTGFKQLDRLSWAANHIDQNFNEWITGLDRAEREQFVETLFSIFAASGEEDFASLSDKWSTTVPAMIGHLGNLPEATRDSFMGAIGGLVRKLVPDFSPKSIAASIGMNGTNGTTSR